MNCEKYDIDGKLIIVKKKPLKPKRSKVSHLTIRNHEIRKFVIDLEHKLPNEFKGSIIKYNQYSDDEYGNIDENEYNFL